MRQEEMEGKLRAEVDPSKAGVASRAGVGDLSNSSSSGEAGK